MKTTKTIAALALAALAGASLVGCSTIAEAVAAPTTVSIEQGTYDHVYTFGDDHGQRLVVDDQGNAGLSTYTCKDGAPTLVKEQLGVIEGNQLIFEEPSGKEAGRAELWQAHAADPETKEADPSRPLDLYEVEGTTFKPSHQDSPCG